MPNTKTTIVCEKEYQYWKLSGFLKVMMNNNNQQKDCPKEICEAFSKNNFWRDIFLEAILSPHPLPWVY